MKSLCLSLSLAAATVLFTGCSTPQTTSAPVAFGAVSSSSSTFAAADGVFYFGAGDALGQEVFATYLASIRSTDNEQYYATGENDFPGGDF